MHQRSWRVLAVLAVVGTLAFATTALVGAAPMAHQNKSSSNQSVISTYQKARQTIESAFRQAVATARRVYNQALAVALNSTERSAARQVFDAAITEAAAVRSAALEALGPNPARHHQ